MQFTISDEIGNGTFGTIYKGTTPKFPGGPVAVKVIDSKHRRQLHYEYKVYQILGRHPGIPIIHEFGSDISGESSYLVMQLFKCDLSSLPLPVALLKVRSFMIQMIRILAHVHGCNIVHRDLKPENIMLDFADNVHLVDFGLAKRYCDPNHKTHIPYTKNRQFAGTPRYASINTHSGIEQTRRDDMMSLAYVCIYLIKGSLPWQDSAPGQYLDIDKKTRNEMILKRKLGISIRALTKNTIPGMQEYMEYVADLNFADCPDYKYLESLFLPLS